MVDRQKTYVDRAQFVLIYNRLITDVINQFGTNSGSTRIVNCSFSICAIKSIFCAELSKKYILSQVLIAGKSKSNTRS